MESFYGDTEDSPEDVPGRKKSKLKSLKTRLFGRSKRAGWEEDAKLSQSASDITAGKGLGSEEDLACSQGPMGSRAMSHDSIFLADQELTDAEPARVLSQENVHSKIKALQMKLQLQKMHLGPPPMVVPIRRPEDPESRSEDDGLPHSPSEISGSDFTAHVGLSKTTSQPFSHPLSPIPRPALPKSVPLTPSLSSPLPVSSNTSSSVVEPPLDFSSPAQFTSCLDTSAARHRMSIKPRNQRASTKKRPAPTDSRSHLDSLNNIDHPETVREEEQQPDTQEEETPEAEQAVVVPVASQDPPSKSPEVAPIAPEVAPKSFPQLDQPLTGRVPPVAPPVLRVKPPRPADGTPTERPHSSYIPSEVKDRREGSFEIQVLSHNKRRMTEVSSEHSGFRSSSAQQPVQVETESTKGIKRPTPGSGSFHFSITTAKNRDGERPRSGSFAGVLEQAEARHRVEEKPFSSMKEKAEHRDSRPRGGPFAAGRLRQEGAPHKASVLPWERRDSLKKVESAAPSKSATADTDVEEKESGQEAVEDAPEAQEVDEDEGRTAFGVKLRSTSQSMRFRSEEQQKRQEVSDTSKKLSSNISCAPSTSGDLRPTDPAPSGFSLPVKHTSPSTCDPPVLQTEQQTTSSNPKEVDPALEAPTEPQPGPQTAPPEVSWMSMALEKTRNLQQLFTSRFPRDFTGTQTAARPQAQAQVTNPTEAPAGAQTQTQTVKVQQGPTPLEAASQPSADAVKAETVQSRSEAQSVKPSLTAPQQRASTTFPVQINTSREPLIAKQISELQPHPNTTQSASQQTNTRSTQYPPNASTLTDTSAQSAHGGVTQSLAQSYLSSGQQQQPPPPWSGRGLHLANQLKSTPPAPASVSTAPSTAAPPAPPASASGRGEREAAVQEKEGAPLTGRRAVWAGSVSERAAFLEKRAEWTAAPGTKGVEVKKAQTEAQTSGESPAAAKTAPVSKDIKPEGRQGVKPSESSPAKVPDPRPREDKWPRKNVPPSSTPPSSSPTMPPALQSMPDSGQPSWMELAKRKSMAWSDKSMD